MNFDLSEEETMVQSLAQRFVQDRYDVERRRGYLANETGFSQENWSLLGELGLIAAPLAPENGGLGFGACALVPVFEALGGGLAVEPLIDNVLIGARLLLAQGQDDLVEVWQDDLATGHKRIALAHAEAASRGVATWVESTAHIEGDHVRIKGIKHCVPAGVGADAFLISARSTGAAGERDGVDLYLVPASQPGLIQRPWRKVDGGAALHLECVDVVVPLSHRLSDGLDGLDKVMPLAKLAQAAEAVGIMQRLFDDTLDYLRTRSQFNTQLGKFQAIQHRMVAQYAVLEQARALINLALVCEGQDGFAQAVDGARAFISEGSISLGHEMIQFHGGMGVSDELAIGHGHKRLLMLSRWPEDAGAALDRFAGLAA
ncbi:acyl-CoA dehydrogenase [Novosphingobium umbonatum]|uniref:Acyl-CoA dehydrogenase n=1 Tax=Novosphingobium umbonatum TaxID=1908524 RepID=A0A3S2Y864_9SPHN|nr:acyl-CoA dehydrogenase family protein [Novosphingobium umbonatum]RVU05730.1 acyl-CoA dehydrogenase [Novosphingobium umbonatum]